MKPIDDSTKFAAWLNQQFEAVAGGADPAPILPQARRVALWLGAGDIVGDTPATQTATLATIGKLLAWCREQTAEILCDADRAAELLHLSPRSLWSLTKSGKVPAMKVGRLTRYSPALLRQWVAENTGIAT